MSAEEDRLNRLGRAAVIWYWSCVQGSPALDTRELDNLWDAIEAIVDAGVLPGRVWTKVEDVPDDVRRVAVDGHGEWVRMHPGGNMFMHVGDVYKIRSLHRLRELGTVREVA